MASAQKRARNVRLWARRPDMVTAGAGLAALAISAALVIAVPSLDAHPAWRNGALWIGVLAGVFGLLLFVRGIFQPLPLIDVERQWNVDYDELRNRTTRFLAEQFDSAWNRIRQKYPEVTGTWKECMKAAPIPNVDARPLREWNDRLARHPSAHVRLAYEVARAVDVIAAGGEFRRLAIRTYDIFWRSARTKPGFREWMEEQRVRDGAEELVVVLAYMEVARAFATNWAARPPHLGFWNLAEEWHPNTLDLPRSRPRLSRPIARLLGREVEGPSS